MIRSEIRSYSTVCCFHRGEGYFFQQLVSNVEDNAYDYDYLADKAVLGFQFDICRNVSKVMYPSLCKETAPAYLVCVCVCMLLLVHMPLVCITPHENTVQYICKYTLCCKFC